MKNRFIDPASFAMGMLYGAIVGLALGYMLMFALIK